MRKSRRCTLFSYAAHDYKAAEAWLNLQAAQGWALDGFSRFPLALARLVPTGWRDLRYCIELTDGRDWEDSGRLTLYADAGWEEVPIPANRNWRLFRSLPGRDPLPLQTDSAMELERFFRKRLFKDLLAVAIAVPLLLLLFWLLFTATPGRITWEGTLFRFLSSGRGLVILLTAITGAPLLLWQIGSELGYWLRCRRLVREGAPFPTPGRRPSRRRAWCAALFHLIYLVYVVFLVLHLFEFSNTYQPYHQFQLREKPVVMAQDVGLPDRGLPCLLRETATPFYRVFELEDHNANSLYSDVYRAAGPSLARLAVAGLLDNYSHFVFTPVELGFDESYLASFGEGESYRILVLRQGGTAAAVSGNIDWTRPDILSILRRRLAL